MTVQVDAAGDSINKYGEQLCGDRIEIVRSASGVTAMLADGKGGGIKANMLASLAVKMMSTLLAGGTPVEEIADMIVESQPAGREDGVSYSAFTLIQVIFGGMIYIAQMETPDVLLFQRGKPVRVETRGRTRQGRLIRFGVSNCGEADTAVAVSNGMLNAGGGRDLENGLRLQDISTFMAHAHSPGVAPEKLVRLLLNAGSSLSRKKPKEDLSAVVFRMKQ